jgi:CHAD domain-containing protein
LNIFCNAIDMKQKKIKKIVEDDLSDIRDCSSRQLGGLDEDCVHDIRVAFKKFRAFIRLQKMAGADKDLRVPRKLKKFYQRAGALRDRQLYFHSLDDHAEKKIFKTTSLKYLIEEINIRKRIISRHLDRLSFEMFNDDVISHLPKKISDKKVAKYFKHQQQRFNKISRRFGSDEEIHNIRKCLKDLLYNAKALEHSTIADSIIRKEDDYKKIIDMIGEYNDTRIALSFLRDDMLRDRRTRTALVVFEKQLSDKKEGLKRDIIHSLA